MPIVPQSERASTGDPQPPCPSLAGATAGLRIRVGGGGVAPHPRVGGTRASSRATKAERQMQWERKEEAERCEQELGAAAVPGSATADTGGCGAGGLPAGDPKGDVVGVRQPDHGGRRHLVLRAGEGEWLRVNFLV